MKFIVYILITFLFTSCIIRDNPKIKIVNNSDKLIDSIEVFAHPINKTVFRYIKPKDKVKGIISFEGIPKQDGGISMHIYENGKKRGSGLAYYTLGGSLSYGFRVSIENDTIIVKDW